jgi:hypothetical protein
MKICKYGITLNLLRQEDLEFVRQKRNSEKAEKLSKPGDEITPDMQQEWFDGINNSENFYFIIEYEGIKIGMLNNKNIDWEARTSETSLFLWEETYSETFVPMLASLCMIEISFYYLNWNASYIRIHKDNPKAIENAGKLGYKITEGKEIVESQLYFLTRELFETKTKEIQLEARSHIEKESGEGYLLLEPLDYESGIAQKIENHFTESGINLHRKGKAGSRLYFR